LERKHPRNGFCKICLDIRGYLCFNKDLYLPHGRKGIMKLQITMHGTTLSVETESDCLNVTEMFNHFKGLMVAIGYHPKSVEECLMESEYEWFPLAEHPVD
jgi:hypothetical protein